MEKNGFQIVLCRHGETEWTLNGQHTSFTDIPLTLKGIEQSKILKERLKAFHFDAVFSSPLQRAKETCDLAGFSKDRILDKNGVEWNYGSYEGKTTEEIQKENPGWNLFHDGAPGGESPFQVGERADLLLKQLIHKGKTIALFSHGHFLRVLAARWLGLSPKDAKLFSLSVASISILSFERSQKVIKLWNWD